MPTYAGQIDVEIEADDEDEAESILEDIRKSVARGAQVEYATASGVECIYECTGLDDYDYDELDIDEEERDDNVPF